MIELRKRFEMVKIVFRINPIVNLFYHLEKGGLSKRYIYAPVWKYRHKALRATERILLDKFSFILDHTALNYLKTPPKPEKYKDERSRITAFYVIQFWEKWQKRIDLKRKQETFEDFLTRLLGETRLRLHSKKR